jgi:hypothetical protein
MQFIKFIKAYKKSSVIIGLVAISIISMWITDTLSYPFIMTERQYQLIRYCVHPSSTFITTEYGYAFPVPEGYCAIPHRIFPDDGTVHIIPKGWYFVFNEYAKGTVTENSVATLLFIHDSNGEEISSNINSLRMGGFLDEATSKEMTNAKGLSIREFDNAKGILEGKRFNWAFIVNPNNKTSLTVLLNTVHETKIYDDIIAKIEAIGTVQ